MRPDIEISLRVVTLVGLLFGISSSVSAQEFVEISAFVSRHDRAHELGRPIEVPTASFDEPGDTHAFGVRVSLDLPQLWMRIGVGYEYGSSAEVSASHCPATLSGCTGEALFADGQLSTHAGFLSLAFAPPISDAFQPYVRAGVGLTLFQLEWQRLVAADPNVYTARETHPSVEIGIGVSRRVGAFRPYVELSKRRTRFGEDPDPLRVRPGTVSTKETGSLQSPSVLTAGVGILFGG